MQPSKRKSVTVTAASSFSGPIPPPSILRGYEDIYSGAANRIIKMAETQSKHRQELEKSVITSNITNERMGMVMAFILTIILMGLGVYLIINGKNVYGLWAIFGPAIFQAGSYIYNKSRERKVTENKNS